MYWDVVEEEEKLRRGLGRGGGAVIVELSTGGCVLLGLSRTELRVASTAGRAGMATTMLVL